MPCRPFRSGRPCRPVLAIASAAVLAVLAGFAALPAGAEPAVAEIRVPAQELGSALDALAAQTGVRLLYSPDAVGGRRAPAVQGTLAAGAALDRLLAGSGLEWTAADGAYAVRPAQGARAEVRALGEIVVTATRTEQRADEVPASVSVIRARDIRSQPATKVEDLLRNVEGVDVKSEAGAGAGMVMLRGVGGSYAGQTTQVLVDGMPVEPLVVTPKGAGFDFADLGEIDRIEVVRGPGSALYGPNAVGGVINILTKRWTGAPGGEVEVGAGSHDGTGARVAVGAGAERFDVRVSASERRTDGFVAQADPDRWGGKDLAGRDWRDRKLGFRLAFYPDADQEISVGARSFDLDSAWLGGRPNYRWSREGTLYEAGYRRDFGDRGDVRVKALKATVEERLSWDGLMVGDPADFGQYVRGRRDESAEALEAQANYRGLPNQLLTAGVSYNRGRQDETEAGDFATWDWFYVNRVESRVEVLGVYLQDQVRIGEATTVTVGGREDRYRLYGNTRYDWDNYDGERRRDEPGSRDKVFNPRVAIRHGLESGASVYASYGTAYLPALHGLRYRSNPACDNPDLKPERSQSYEVGMNAEVAGWRTRVAAFHTDYEDKLETVQTPDFCARYLNVSEVTVDGLEFAFDGRLGEAWRPYLNYTFSDSRVAANPNVPASEGRRLNLVARHKLNLGVVWTPLPGTSVRLAGRAVGDRYADGTLTNAEGGRIPGYFVADLKLSQRLPASGWVRESEVSLAISNLFDRRYVESRWLAADGVENFHAFADRSNWWLTLRLRF